MSETSDCIGCAEKHELPLGIVPVTFLLIWIASCRRDATNLRSIVFIQEFYDGECNVPRYLGSYFTLVRAEQSAAQNLEAPERVFKWYS